MRIVRMACVGFAALACACVDEAMAPPPAVADLAETREIVIVGENGNPIRLALVTPLEHEPGTYGMRLLPDSSGRVVLPAALARVPIRIRAIGHEPFTGRLAAVSAVQVIRMRFAVLTAPCIMVTPVGAP